MKLCDLFWHINYSITGINFAVDHGSLKPTEFFDSFKKYIKSQAFLKLILNIYVFELFTYCNSGD